MNRFFLLIVLSASFLHTDKGLAAESFVQASLISRGETVAVFEPVISEANTEQKSYYRERLGRLRTHHLELPLARSLAAFSTRRSTNKQVIKPRDQAYLDDSIDVNDKIPVTQCAKMDYGYVSPVAEPSAAIAQDQMLVTFNWGAVWSPDSGATFRQIDPGKIFSNPPPSGGGEFCCDQVALYIPSHDLLVWLLQGTATDQGNTIRILTATGSGIAERRFRVHDLTPSSTGNWNGEWFDFPDLQHTNNHLFVSLNTFDDTDRFRRAAIVRIPLAEFVNGGALNADVFSSTSRDDFAPRLINGAKERMYWATHRDDQTLIVRRWSDQEAQPTITKQVRVERWAIPDGNSTIAGSQTDAGMPWLKRLDGRITAGWRADGTIGFGWSSGRIEGSDAAAYQYPHVRVAIIKESDFETTAASSDLRPLSEPHVWSSNYSMAYPGAAVNENGDVGFAVFFGGKKHFPSSAVGVFGKHNDDWKLRLTVLSTGKGTPRCIRPHGVIDATCGVWGDFLTVRPHPKQRNAWYVAAQTEEGKGVLEAPKVVVTVSPFSLREFGSTPTSRNCQ